MKKTIIILIILGALITLYFGFLRQTPIPPPQEDDQQEPVAKDPDNVRIEALYACAEEKRLHASLQKDSADITLDDGRQFTIARLSRVDDAEGDTAGYESADGAVRFVISSGFQTSAFLSENGVETYRECTALAEGSAALETRIDRGASGAGVKIVPLEVLEDSRCPIDVVCIQAGTVRVRALLSSGLGEAEQVFELGLPITTEAEEVTLSTVLPAPRSTERIEPGGYRFYFSVDKRPVAQ